MYQQRDIFLGSIAPECMQQILRTVDFSSWKECFVGCSGTFTFEKSIKAAYPHLAMHGNDVGLLSCVLAGIARKEPVAFEFVGRLAHWEQMLQGADYMDRAAALILAMQLGRAYTGKSEHARRHWLYYENRFPDFVTKAREQVLKFTLGIQLDSYFAGDFREHLFRGIERGAGVIVSAPFNLGFYEQWFKFINANIRWAQPPYEMWNPDHFPALIEKIEETGAPYVAVYKSNIREDRLCAYFRVGLKPAYYVFSNSKRLGSVVDRNTSGAGKPFRFEPIDITRIKRDSHVEIVQVKAAYADYIKGLYLQETIRWTSAPLNFLVYVDNMLAGILCFSPPKFGIGEWTAKEVVYLLSDTATSRFGRVSKLIAMLASQVDVVRVCSRRLLHRRPVKAVVTTVRSNNPVSMKYRGIYQMLNRKETDPSERETNRYIINYAAEPRDQTPQQVFQEWFDNHFKDDRGRKVTTSYAK